MCKNGTKSDEAGEECEAGHNDKVESPNPNHLIL